MKVRSDGRSLILIKIKIILIIYLFGISYGRNFILVKKNMENNYISNFIPILIRSLVKMIIFKLFKKKDKYTKYRYRLNGLIQSMLNKKSNLRI